MIGRLLIPLASCVSLWLAAALAIVPEEKSSSPSLPASLLCCACREGKAQLQLAGAADPTGRGFGYSFVRDIRHKVSEKGVTSMWASKARPVVVQGMATACGRAPSLLVRAAPWCAPSHLPN